LSFCFIILTLCGLIGQKTGGGLGGSVNKEANSGFPHST